MLLFRSLPSLLAARRRRSFSVLPTSVKMFLQTWFLLVTLTTFTFGSNPGVKVALTQKGLEYGREIGIAVIQQKLSTIKLPDISGSQKVNPIGKVSYSFTNMHIVNVGLPQSAVSLVPGAGVKLSIGNAYMSLNGNWRVKYLRFFKDSGSFDLNVNGLNIMTTITISSDETGRPTVSGTNCAASVGSVRIKFHGGASWLYNLFTNFIDKALRSTLEKQICPLVNESISDVNPYLKTLNVLAKVDEYAEIEYSLVSSPVISTTSVDLSLKGEFYNIRKHQEPPFTPAVFSLPPQSNSMLNIGLSSYTANSASFVYSTAGALSLYITDDMIPASSPVRLNTQTFGAFIPQIAQRFPGLMMKLLVKSAKSPVITLESDNATIQASGTITAYAIQVNGTLSPLFVLNMAQWLYGCSMAPLLSLTVTSLTLQNLLFRGCTDQKLVRNPHNNRSWSIIRAPIHPLGNHKDGSVSTQLFIRDTRVAGSVSLNKMDLTLGTSYVGDFQVKSLDRIFQMVLKVVIIPKLNAELGKGYPLPSIGQMKLVNTQLQIMKGYMLIGTDVQFTGC